MAVSFNHRAAATLASLPRLNPESISIGPAGVSWISTSFSHSLKTDTFHHNSGDQTQGLSSMKKQNRILVTGAGGFIGHHLVNQLKSEGHWVRGVDLKEPEYEH